MSKVLIIEDDLNLQKTTSEFLQEEGFNVIAASNGVEGIQFAVEELPDIIICDIAMPKLNGYEVFKYLSENSSTHKGYRHHWYDLPQPPRKQDNPDLKYKADSFSDFRASSAIFLSI